MKKVMFTGNKTGLVMIAKITPSTKRVEPVQPVHRVNDDPKFRYYYNLYFKSGNSVSI